MIQYKYNCPNIKLIKDKSEYYGVKIQSSKDSADYCRQFYQDDMELYESMFLLLMNKGNNTIGWVKIGQGGIDGTVGDPRIIAKYCVEALATGAIICHNHPSGNLQPSRADEEITQKVKQTLAIFDCKLLDHLILTTDGYYSFSDERIL